MIEENIYSNRIINKKQFVWLSYNGWYYKPVEAQIRQILEALPEPDADSEIRNTCSY